MLATDSGDIANYALAVFLIVVAIVLAIALVALAGVFSRLASLIRSTEREAMPVINKVGGSVDRINLQLDKADVATDSAVDAVVAADEAVRSVSFVVRRPIQRLVGATAGASHGWATLRARRDWKAAIESAKEASQRREQDFEDELRQARGSSTRGVGETPAA